MADAIVLDASAAIALLRREPAAEAVRSALDTSVEILVPDQFWLEIVNVLVRRHRWMADAVVAALRDLDELDLTTTPLGRASLLLALDRAVRFDLTACDAQYLALAEASDAWLLTLDAELAGAAGGRALPVPGVSARSPRLAEERAGYGESLDWSRLGRYLADLRADAGA
ncbi:MAG: PIN domain-containing protein [Chloroflexota bacterium]|nr:MAG: PIN domain-containing protein [Chloroflexota bacterium]